MAELEKPANADYREGKDARRRFDNDMLKLAAFVLCCTSNILCLALATQRPGLVAPLAWTVPLTIRCWNIYKGRKPNTATLDIALLLLVNAAAGALLLIADKEKPRQARYQGGVE